MCRILVTGGAGFIGSHTCITLLEKNYKIVVVDSFINSKPESLNRVTEICNLNDDNKQGNLDIFKGDIRDQDFLNNIFEKYNFQGQRIEGVIHFAGLKSVSESVFNPLSYWDSNVAATINLLNVMNSFDCKTIVFSSSATIYGSSESNYIKETTLINPVNTYGSTKYVIEQILNTLFKSDNQNWRIANLRYFNPVGAHVSGKIGEDPSGIPNNIFPYLTKVAIGHYDKFQIFGKDWPTPDGTGIRDYIHVMDLAEAHLNALRFLKKHDSQIINLNIGTGEGTSVIKFLKTFEEVNKIKINYVFTDRRDGDVPRLVADSSLAKKLLNWFPKRTIEDVCRDGWKWQSLNPSGY